MNEIMNGIMDFLLPCFNALDPFLAEFVFGWEATVTGIISIIVTAGPWILNAIRGNGNSKKRNHYKLQVVFSVVVVFVGSFLTLYVKYVNDTYICVPKITLNQYTYGSAKYKLQAADFNVILVADEVAQAKLDEGVDENASYFKVVDMKPKSDEFVKRYSEVTVYVTWNKGSNNININKAEQSAKEFYSDINNNEWHPLNSDEFTLYTGETALLMNIEANREDALTHNELSLAPQEQVEVSISLYNFETGEIVETRSAKLGDAVTFSGLADGVYYYEATAEGYKTAITENPFRLEYDSSKEKEVLPWSLNMEKTDANYSESYKIQLQDETGAPLCNASAYVRVVRAGSDALQYSSMQVYTNDEGYLTMWSMISANGEETVYYDLIDFSVADGYAVEVSYISDNDYRTVNIENGVGVCRIET